MSSLQAAPFHLAYGEAVVAKIIAFNSIGDGPASSIGGDAVSATVPDAPILLTRNGLLTTTS